MPPSISGIIDVLASVNSSKFSSFFKDTFSFLESGDEFLDSLDSFDSGDYEIIIEYKGMKRPPVGSEIWKRHYSQIQTYAGLRNNQKDSKPVALGIIFYLNELEPSEMDIKSIGEDIINGVCDISSFSEDLEKIKNWDSSSEFPKLSRDFKLNRCIRLVDIDNRSIDNVLGEFEEVVSHIENSIVYETEYNSIKKAWVPNGDKRTCNGCDFRFFCEAHIEDDFQIP